MLYGILGNSLIFVLKIFSLCFSYSGFQMEGLGMIAKHTQHVSAYCELLWLIDVLLNIGYSGFMKTICIND